jgi:hypothetical protein
MNASFHGDQNTQGNSESDICREFPLTAVKDSVVATVKYVHLAMMFD